MNPYQRRIRDALCGTRPNYSAALEALRQAVEDTERGLLTMDELRDIAGEAS